MLALSHKLISPGIRYMFLSTIGFTLMGVIVKELAHLHVSQIVFFRSGITAIICWYFLKREGVSFGGNNKLLLILRSLFGIISMTLFFITIQRIPFGASVSLKYLSPIFTAIFAVIFLKEKVKIVQWLLFAGAFTGVLLLKGFDARIDFLNLTLGITGAALAGLVYVTIRKLGTSEHSLVIINYFMSSAMVLSGIVMLFFWQMPYEKEWVMLLLMGTFGYFGQFYMTKAFQVEAASLVVPVKYTEVVNALIIGLVWFGEGYTVLSLVGIILIVFCMLLNLIYKTR